MSSIGNPGQVSTKPCPSRTCSPWTPLLHFHPVAGITVSQASRPTAQVLPSIPWPRRSFTIIQRIRVGFPMFTGKCLEGVGCIKGLEVAKENCTIGWGKPSHPHIGVLN